MKSTLLISIFLLASCSRLKPVPKFDAQKVCAPEDYAYLQKTTDRPAEANEKAKQWSAEMEKIQPLIQRCYKENLDRTMDPQGFNVCLIADYDKDGKQKFFNFSSQEYAMSYELKKCLNDLSSKIDTAGIKDISFVQPVKLHTK